MTPDEAPPGMSDVAANKNVCTEIVAHDLCIGCGLCAGVCPGECLRVAPDGFGEYTATCAQEQCVGDCGLCLRVCPFSDQPDDEDTLARARFEDIREMKHDPAVGYHLESLVGYSRADGHRESGASGGLATWMLEALLREGLVDEAVCVAPVPGGAQRRLFEFVACRTPDEVRRCSRSCYHPVELSGAVRRMLREDKRYAVTALPCSAKALRRAMEALPRLGRRVKFILGLVCGHGKSRFFGQYLCALGGGDPARLDEVVFRIKDPRCGPRGYGTRFVSGDGTDARREATVYAWDWAPDTLWADGYFTPNACFFCDDVFAECADATFMDAWLEPFTEDWRGHSIVVSRRPELTGLLRRARETGELSLQPVAIADVVRSQQVVVDMKRGAIREWIRLAQAEGRRVPRKRSHLFRETRLLYWERVLTRAQWHISHESRRRWPESGRRPARFREMMAPWARKAWLARRVRAAIERPWAVPAAVLRRLRRILTR